MPGDEAFIWDTVFASSNVTPPTIKSIISCGFSRVDPPTSTNGYCCSRRRPLMRFCNVNSNRGECCVYTFSTPFRPLKRSRAPENIPADSNMSEMPPATWVCCKEEWYVRSFATRSMRFCGTFPTAPSKSTSKGKAFDGCFSYRKEYRATRRSLDSDIAAGDWMSR